MKDYNFKKDICQELTREELIDRCCEQNETILYLKNKINKATFENTQSIIIESSKKADQYAKIKHDKEYYDPAFNRDVSETTVDYMRGFMDCYSYLSDILWDTK